MTTITLLACAPSGEAAFYMADGQLWLMHYPRPRHSDQRELSRAVSEGFIPLEEQLGSYNELDDRMAQFRRQWLEQLPPEDEYLSRYNAQTVWRMLFTLRATVENNRADISDLRAFAARMLKDCPAVREENQLHAELVDLLSGTPDPIGIKLSSDVDPVARERVAMSLAA